jgi:hypothetical protein
VSNFPPTWKKEKLAKKWISAIFQWLLELLWELTKWSYHNQCQHVIALTKQPSIQWVWPQAVVVCAGNPEPHSSTFHCNFFGQGRSIIHINIRAQNCVQNVRCIFYTYCTQLWLPPKRTTGPFSQGLGFLHLLPMFHPWPKFQCGFWLPQNFTYLSFLWKPQWYSSSIPWKFCRFIRI